MGSAIPGEFACFQYVDTPVFVVATQRQGGYRLLYTNAAHEHSTGLRAKDICGRSITEVFPAKLAALMRSNYDTARSQSRPYSYREVLCMQDKGLWYETTLVTMPPQSDGTYRIVGTSVDVTRKTDRAIAETFARSDFEAFLGVAAHDLRAPMRQVQDIARLLRQDFTDLGDGKAELIDTLDEIGQRSVRLVEDILTFVEADSLNSATEPVSLDKLCQQMLTLLDLHNRHTIAVTPVIIETDPLILQIVLRNLIENTVKHGGNAELSIRVEASAETDDLVNLWYSDNGRGLEGRDVLATGTDSDYRQTGYGLATVRRMLQSRGGSVHVMPSRFDTGASFALVVPVQIRLCG